MNHKISKKLKALVLASMASVIGLGITGCDDEIDKSNRFTFKAELISTHLQNNPDKFSSFTSILSKAKLGNKSSGSILKTLSTYGSYTCFAPTNEAIDAFLAQEYEKYLNGENTGITDPSIEFLSDSMATVIAKNHIIEMGYKTIDISSGAFPGNTMSGRFTTVFWDNDEVTGQVYIMLNNSARIIAQDLEMENGYIQVIDGVLNPSNKLLPELIGSHNSFSLFHEAIMLTGLDALLSQFEIDPEYDGTAESTARLASESNSKAPYPKYNNKRFTVLVEPDELYKSLGYETIDDIIALANKWYTTTKTGAPITDEIRNDYTHRDNPLNQYVAYHIIDRQLKYSSSTSPGGFIMENYVNEGYSSLVNLNQSFDSYEYYETMMPNTMIKVT
ncbi:MAG: fasciclin domain-containing protein [Bacteroidaceae bacterium]|nr:fasciclin domain-containing protein [Bacteroidaceae bacterium]